MSDEVSKTRVVLEGRFSYLSVFEPRVIEGSNGEPKYYLSLIMDKDTKASRVNIKRAQAAIEAAKELGKTKCPKWGGKVPKMLKISLKDGDEREHEDKNPEYDHAMILNCSATLKSPPGIVDAQGKEMLDPRKLFSGCYGKIEVNFFPYDKGSNGIGCGLNFVMLTEEGEPLAGRRDAAAAFGIETDDADDIL